MKKIICDLCGKEVSPSEGFLEWKSPDKTSPDYAILHKAGSKNSPEGCLGETAPERSNELYKFFDKKDYIFDLLDDILNHADDSSPHFAKSVRQWRELHKRLFE